MHFKLDIMEILDADNAFSCQSTSHLLPSMSQFPRNQREITAENLREAGSWYKTLGLITHIIVRIFKKKKPTSRKQTTKPKKLTGKLSYATLEVLKSLTSANVIYT